METKHCTGYLCTYMYHCVGVIVESREGTHEGTSSE